MEEILNKLIEDQEFIIQCLLLRGDDESKLVASRAMDSAVVMMLMEAEIKKTLRDSETLRGNDV